jgi:hypothetical protein
MKSFIRLVRNAAAAFCVVASLIPVAPSRAQGGTKISVNAPDSVSFVVARRGPLPGEPAIRTLSGEVALILRDSVVVLQLTDYGLDHLFDGDRETRRGGSRILMAMVKAGLSGLFDHGVAYRVSALRRAYAEGNRLVLEDRAGDHVFESTNYNDHHPMVEFSPAEARRFAMAVQRSIASHRRMNRE